MQFHIKAIDSLAGIRMYAVDAPDEATARRAVLDQGAQVISVRSGRASLFRLRSQRLPVVQFTEQLIALLDAGLSLVEAIEALVEKESNPAMQRTLRHLLTVLYEGAPLSAGMAQLPEDFPALYVATVRASERTGAIREAMMRYVAYQKQVNVLRSKLVSASIYPIVLCCAGLLVTLFLLGYVVPRFSGIYQDLGGNLPWASRLMMQWGQFLSAHGQLVLAATMLGLAAFGYAATRPDVRAAIARALARIPVVGRQLHTYQIARMYRTVGMLLRGGVPAVSAMQMSRGILAANLQVDFDAATQAIREGQSLASAMFERGLTTPVAVRMLRVGERGGNMGEMMERIAAFYDDEMARAVDVLTRLIEPLMMAAIGLVIGVIVLLMYFPIFELAGNLQ